MIYLWYVIYFVLQCTWGALQTLVGLIFFIANINKPHSFYKGCINTKWNLYGGISLGLFIFTPNEDYKEFEQYSEGSHEKVCEAASKIRVHEYGHTYQSLLLGPFYIIPGIISICWANMKRYRCLREKYGVPYSFCWVEAWADRLGEKVTGMPSIGSAE